MVAKRRVLEHRKQIIAEITKEEQRLAELRSEVEQRVARLTAMKKELDLIPREESKILSPMTSCTSATTSSTNHEKVALFLTLPVSWKGTLVQYTGRLHRLHQGKTEVRIYDYLDSKVPMLAKMFERRLRGYRAIGYTQEE